MRDILQNLGLTKTNSGVFDGRWGGKGETRESVSPGNGKVIASVREATADEFEEVTARAVKAFEAWRSVPAPRRGEVIRQLGNALRATKKDLAKLVTIECGKILAEAEGEVQEMIDICDFAVGLSRQLYGLTMPSERPGHRLMEQWHPLGPVGIITAFNFPVAVWAWNSALAGVCGDSTVWKPSEKTPLTAVAVIRIAEKVCRDNGVDPAVFSLACGTGKIVGRAMTGDRRYPLVSATGSCAMGGAVGQAVAARMGRSLLELGGNNAIIVSRSAPLDMAVRGIFFGSVGTAGQRCTTTRRVIVHESIMEKLEQSLLKAYQSVRIGDPLDPKTLMGPLIDVDAVESMQKAIRRIRKEGGEILYGGERLEGKAYPGGCYVTPCLARARNDMAIVREETFGPILYLIPYREFNEAVAMQNAVPQGLSSAIFTSDQREAELFLSATGSDCGIANVNVGTSGAEIGGAFGGEKETGGGRESGSDAWKSYMRRQTNTINYSDALPLAQGIKFDL
jgi:aldehyde dehydrogenase (NAD+)